ncbi:MAG: hypothetical protein V4671_19520 [Armatimonadota bacterium]
MNTQDLATANPADVASSDLFVDDLPPTAITLPPVSLEDRADDDEFLFHFTFKEN